MPLHLAELKKIVLGIEKNNELLQTLIDLQQPKAEVVLNTKTRKPRGPRNGNQK